MEGVRAGSRTVTRTRCNSGVKAPHRVGAQ